MRSFLFYLKYRIIKAYNLLSKVLAVGAFAFCLGMLLGVILGWASSLLVFLILGSMRTSKLILLGVLIGIVLNHAYASSLQEKLSTSFSKQESITATVITDVAFEDINQKAIVTSEQGYSIWLKLPAFPRIAKGDKINFSGQVNSINEIDLPGFTQFLYSQGVTHVASIMAFSLVQKNNSSDKLIYDIKQNWIDILSRNLPPNEATLVAGVLFGVKSGFSEELEQALKISGTSHIVSVSGYNVSVLISFLLLLAGRINRRSLYKYILLGITLFILLVGQDNLPALRAGFMGAVIVIALMIGKQSATYQGLLYACLIMLAMNPMIWLNSSFQLSVMAFVGVIMFTAPLEGLMKNLPTMVSDSLAPTLAVSITTLPITYLSFGSYSLVGLLSNIVILPFVPILMIVSFTSLLVAGLFPFLSELLFFNVYLLAKLITTLISIFGSLAMFQFTNPITVVIIYFLFIVILIYSDFTNVYKKLLHKKYYRTKHILLGSKINTL